MYIFPSSHLDLKTELLVLPYYIYYVVIMVRVLAIRLWYSVIMKCSHPLFWGEYRHTHMGGAGLISMGIIHYEGKKD